MHSAPTNKNAFLNLRYDEKVTSYMFLKAIKEQKEPTFNTANDLVISWRNFFKLTIEDRNIEIHQMHHEQFGMLMYHFFHVCKHKSKYIQNNRFTAQQASNFPNEDFASQLAFTSRDSFDRMFPLCWLEIIGYPEFWDLSIYGDTADAQSYATYCYLMRLLVIDLNIRLKKSGGDATKLQIKI